MITLEGVSQKKKTIRCNTSICKKQTLYNIRRERRCEFIGEGFRQRNLLRWRSFDAQFLSWRT